MERIRKSGAIGLVVLFIALALAACGSETPTAEAPSLEEHFDQGNEFAQAGDFEKAIAEYQAVLEMAPDNVSALANLGVAFYSTGKLDEAVTQYEKALELEPGDADIHSNLGAAYVQLGQLDQALGEYQKAVEINPDLAEAQFGLGVVYVQMGKPEEAIQAFETFQRLDSGKDQIATQQAEQYLQQLKGQ
jgi:Flp pilus assembly protein TadD